jgi:CheY-like chemotaxis protein
MLKILLADADRLFLELAKTFLRKTGVEVLTCMNGNELLELIRDKNPDLVFLSTNMPSGNGLECFQSIKQDEVLRSITIVMTSATGKGEEFDKYVKAGADELLVKPISRHTFMATVNKFLNLEKRYNSRFKHTKVFMVLHRRIFLPANPSISAPAVSLWKPNQCCPLIRN